MELKNNLKNSYIECSTIEQTEKVVLILLSYGFHWVTGHRTIKPGDEKFYSTGNTIYVDIFDISFGHIYSTSDFRRKNRKKIEIDFFLKSY